TPPQSLPIRGKIRVHPAFCGLLEQHGLSDFDAILDEECGTPLRRLATRENWRLELADSSGKVTTLYLKKHRVRSLANQLRALFRLPYPPSPARLEAKRTAELASLGVPTMTVVAYAERLRLDGTLTAAFLTEELHGFEQLDLFLSNRFRDSSDPALRQLVVEVAATAARFHGLGFNHRDFYSCHFFVKERKDPGCESTPPDEMPSRFDVHLIDLQRVQHWPVGLRRRWVVKDLAQLAYSVPPRLVSASH